MMFSVIRLVAFTVMASCQSISFDPDFHVADYQNQAIINERGDVIYSDDPSFNQFACMHKDKIKELREILIRARMPNKAKRIINNKYKNLNDRISH